MSTKQLPRERFSPPLHSSPAAQTILFPVSGVADYIIGTTISIDVGMLTIASQTFGGYAVGLPLPLTRHVRHRVGGAWSSPRSNYRDLRAQKFVTPPY